MSKSLWPIVAMVAVLCTAIVVMLTITPDENMATRSASLMLLSMLGPLLTGVWVTRHQAEKAEEVKQLVAETSEEVAKVKQQVRKIAQEGNSQ